MSDGNSHHLTIGEIAAFFAVETWRVRRVVDKIAPDLPRAGRYRLVPRALLGEVAVALQERGWLPNDARPVVQQQ